MTVEWLQLVNASNSSANSEEPLPPWLFWTYLGVSIALVTMAGLMSGLTLGLMSLDELDLEVGVETAADVDRLGTGSIRERQGRHQL